jgi:hypothetical protein
VHRWSARSAKKDNVKREPRPAFLPHGCNSQSRGPRPKAQPHFLGFLFVFGDELEKAPVLERSNRRPTVVLVGPGIGRLCRLPYRTGSLLCHFD